MLEDVLLLFLRYCEFIYDLFILAKDSSFCMPILTAIISGGLTLIGVLITLNYYKKRDEEKEIQSNAPFFKYEILGGALHTLRQYYREIAAVLNIPVFRFDNFCDLREPSIHLMIVLTNAGKNVAKNIEIECNDEVKAFYSPKQQVLSPNDFLFYPIFTIDEAYKEKNIKDEEPNQNGHKICFQSLGITVKYSDIYMNIYRQVFKGTLKLFFSQDNKLLEYQETLRPCTQAKIITKIGK